MADHTPTGPLETGASMDYKEHEHTYAVFTGLVKYGSVTCASLLVAMAFGFFAGGGFLWGLILFVLLVAVGSYLLR